MLLRNWMINLLLAACTIFFGIKAYEVWSREEPAVQQSASAGQTESPAVPTIPSTRRIPLSDYESVATQDLFSPDRKEPEPGETPTSDSPSLPRRKFSGRIVLYGVVVGGDRAEALVSNPTPARGEPKTLWVKQGDLLANQTVSRVLSDRIVLSDGDDTSEILLYDHSNPKNRGGVKNTSQPVVVTSGQPPSKSTAVASRPAKPNLPRQRETTTPAKAPAPRKTAERKSPASRDNQKSNETESSSSNQGSQSPFETLLQKLTPKQ